MARQRGDDAPQGDAARLMALARDACAAGIGRRVLLLRLSLLPVASTPPHHLRMVRDALSPLLAADRAQFFSLPSRDLALVWRGAAAEALQRSLDAVRLLFADSGLDGADRLALLLDLPGDAESLMLQISRPPRAAPPPPLAPSRRMDPVSLGVLERALVQASVDRFQRRRAICSDGARGFELAWERRFLALDEIFETLMPDCDPRADPWLLYRLRRSLDRRLLASLCQGGAGGGAELREAEPFAIELNVASILGAEFLRFDTLLPRRLRGQVLLTLRPADILCDLASFQFARDFARARGYRLMLRGRLDDLALLPVERLGLDLLALSWSDALIDPLLAALLPAPERLVLERVDNAAAMEWARAFGPAYLQGGMVAPRL